MDVSLCPCCNTSSARVFDEGSPGLEVVLDGQAFYQEPYSIAECSRCSLLYKTKTLSPREFADYYAKVDFRKWETASFYPPERMVLKELSNLPHGAAILDYGCSSGRLLAPLVAKYRCFGYEINEIAASEASAKGIQIVTAAEMDRPKGMCYDAILMIDVFEHLSSPLQTLAELVRLLKVGGRLFVVTGNGDCRLGRLEGGDFWYFRTVEHVAMLTQKNALWLAEQLQLRVIQWRELCHYDWKWREVAVKSVKHFSYSVFRRGTAPIKAFFRLLPIINRAERWTVSPAFNFSADHVVAIFQKLPELSPLLSPGFEE